MRGVEVQAQKERLPRGRVAVDELHRVVAEQIGEIAVLARGHAVGPQIGIVVEIIRGASADAVEMVVAALERAVFRQRSQMPFAHQHRRVTRPPKLRGQRRQPRWEPHHHSVVASGQGFFEADGQAVLIAARDDGRARGRAYGRVGIGLQEAHAARRDPVDVRRLVLPAAVAGGVGVTEIVGENEHDVGIARLRAAACGGRERQRARGAAKEKIAPCDRHGGYPPLAC
jgi:hypothetical protein